MMLECVSHSGQKLCMLGVYPWVGGFAIRTLLLEHSHQLFLALILDRSRRYEILQ